MTDKIIIIGAGVIGASIALTLIKEGHSVTLVDNDGPCSGASFGNAGAVVNGSCAPTAMPGIAFNAIKMFSQPDSPLSIKAPYIHKIFPWLLRFILQSRSSAVYKNAANLHALSKYAVQSWQQLIEHTKLTSLFRETGWLKVYESTKTFTDTKISRELLDRMGSKYEILTAENIQDLEPKLAPIFNYGFYQADSLSITDPQRLVHDMVDLFVDQGGTYQQFSTQLIKKTDNKVYLSGTNGNLSADKVVIATGAWSRTLAKQLGDNIPLDTERGYHLMFPESTASLLKRPVVNGENSFVLSPMTTGLRMTSQIEFAGLDIPPDYSKIRNLLPHVKRMLPHVDTREESAWMGFRPSLPDSLPVLGFSTKSNNILYAFGHQHLGMTLAAITGNVVADLINNKTPRVPIFPYRPNRFNKL